MEKKAKLIRRQLRKAYTGVSESSGSDSDSDQLGDGATTRASARNAPGINIVDIFL